MTGWQLGQRAVGIAFTGGYAEFAVVPAPFLTPIPDAADDAVAVALVRSGQVALGVLRAANPQPGESVLVTGAAGGVGHLAVQLAKAFGAGRVVAAVGSDGKTGFLKEIGADEVIRYDHPEWPGPVDVVLDGTGCDVQTTALEVLAPFGRLVSYNANGAMVDVNQLRLHAKTVIGFAMAPFARLRPEVYARHHRELWDMHLAGSLRPAIHATLPLDEVGRAHELILSRANLGKVVLVP